MEISMKNGIYAVTFSTPNDRGEGLLMIRDGAINGGDEHFLYQGILTGSGGAWSGELNVTQWKAGNTTVFGTTGNYLLDARFSYDTNSHSFSGTASVRNESTKVLSFSAQWIANLV
jgi:hypothetical protein